MADALVAELLSLIHRLESEIPRIAKTHVGDAIVSERLTTSAALRSILKAHGHEIPEIGDDLMDKIRDRLSDYGN